MGDLFGSSSGIVFENARASLYELHCEYLSKIIHDPRGRKESININIKPFSQNYGKNKKKFLNFNEHATQSTRNVTHFHLSYLSVQSTAITLYSQLSYIGQDLQKIPPVISKFYGARVETLDLSYNCLTTLQGVENFIHLKELILDNNELSDNLTLPKMESLFTLSINKNKISNLESFLQKVRDSFPFVRYLSLLGNKACPNQLSDISKDEEDYKRYRYFVINQLPRLQFLDSTPVTREEKEEARRRGHLMKIAKPLNVNESGNENEPSPIMKYTPLPRRGRDIDDHQGAYGKCRYRYSGKHSEGNRFIQNNDL